mgnify:FL=1
MKPITPVRKVCLVHYSSAPGGIEVLIPTLVRIIPGTLFSAFVIRPPEKGKENVYKDIAVDVTYGSLNNLKAARRLRNFARMNSDALFHCFNTGPFFLLQLRLTGVKKAVYSIHGTLHFNGILQKLFRKLIWRMALSSKYRLVANSGHSRDIFLDFISPLNRSIDVVYNPIGSERMLTGKEGTSADRMNIIYAGRLAEGKNLHRWLDIAALIHEQHSEARFFIYGDGPLMDELQRYTLQIGAGGYVTFEGFMHDIGEAYRKADLMIFLSEKESFGNVAVESILCGTPVIASAIPSMKEIFINYPQFLVPADERMDEAVLQKLGSLDTLRQSVNDAREEFLVRFSMGQHAEKIEKIYDSFTGPDGRNK